MYKYILNCFKQKPKSHYSDEYKNAYRNLWIKSLATSKA